MGVLFGSGGLFTQDAAGGASTPATEYTQNFQDLAANTLHDLSMTSIVIPDEQAIVVQFFVMGLDQTNATKSASYFFGAYTMDAGVLTFQAQQNLGQFSGCGFVNALSAAGGFPTVRYFANLAGGLKNVTVQASVRFGDGS